LLQIGAGRSESRALSHRKAFGIVCVRVRRQVLGLRLAGPSATASAKFAKITVNQSQKVIWAAIRIRSAGDETLDDEMVVSMETSSTTNITGLRISVRGLSFWRCSPTR